MAVMQEMIKKEVRSYMTGLKEQIGAGFGILDLYGYEYGYEHGYGCER